MRIRALLSGFTLCVGACAVNLVAADWPHWRGPNGNGISDERVSTSWSSEGPSILWRGAVGKGFSSVSISQGRAYTLGNTNEQDSIWCLDARTGKEIWKHTYPARLDPQFYEGGPSSTPTVHEGRVYAFSKWGNVFCLDAATGKVFWETKLWDVGIRSNRWGFAGSPVVWQDRLILNAGGSGSALDLKTGKILWFNGTNVAGYATPQLFMANGKPGFLIFGAKNLYAVEPTKGTELWRYPWETGYDVNNTDPLIRGTRVFITSYNRGCALLETAADPPSLVYEEKRALRNHLGPGVVVGDYLYSFNGEAGTKTDFRCVHLPTAEVKWTTTDPAFGSLISVNGKLLVLSEKGELDHRRTFRRWV